MLAERLCNARLSRIPTAPRRTIWPSPSRTSSDGAQQANLFAAADEGRQSLDNAGFEFDLGRGFRRSPARASSRPQFP